MTEDEMIGWHHQLNGHEFEQTPGDGEGQRSLVCCSPWGCKESDIIEQLSFTFSPRLYLLCFIVLPVFIEILFRNGHKSVAIDEDLPNESKHDCLSVTYSGEGGSHLHWVLADTQRQAGG